MTESTIGIGHVACYTKYDEAKRRVRLIYLRLCTGACVWVDPIEITKSLKIWNLNVTKMKNVFQVTHLEFPPFELTYHRRRKEGEEGTEMKRKKVIFPEGEVEVKTILSDIVSASTEKLRSAIRAVFPGLLIDTKWA